MDDTTDPRDLAADKRRERETRIHRLRMRIAGVAVALFVAVWTGLFVQLVTGHDPALANDAAPVTQSADPAVASDDDAGWGEDASSSDTSGVDPSSSSSSSSDTAQSSSSSSSAPADVTTGQS